MDRAAVDQAIERAAVLEHIHSVLEQRNAVVEIVALVLAMTIIRADYMELKLCSTISK